MAKNKINLPSSGAGITRYFDDYKSKLEFKPGVVIVFAILVMIFMIFLEIYGYSLFGL